MKSSETPLAVLGAGSWGTALAILAARKNRTVLLWDRDPKHLDSIRQTRRNVRYLPDIELPRSIFPVRDFSHIVSQTKGLIIAVPSHAFRNTLGKLKNDLPKVDRSWQFCWGTKGIESETGKLLSDVFDEVIGPSVTRAALSGPSFAREVAVGLPTAMTIAASNRTEAEKLASWFRNSQTRIYTTNDFTGVQLGGAIKNVIAIAAGISDGLGFGLNARAALITRGLAEMARLGVALGGRADTFMGLSGVGDLILTCTDNQSRNRRLGLGIGQGGSLADIVEEIDQEAEGLHTSQALFQKGRRLGIDLPITEQVCGVLFESVDPRTAVRNLLDREPQPEMQKEALKRTSQSIEL